MAVASGVREALARGIVVHSGELFERANESDVVAFDKTGTLTTGRMAVHAVSGDDETLSVAAALERFADHPVADAIVARAAGERRTTPAEAQTVDRAAAPDGGGQTVTDVETHPGRGVSGTVGGREALVGSADLFEARGWAIPERFRRRATDARDAGAVPALVGWEGSVRGVVVAGDEPRPEWETVVDALSRDHRVVVITGDGEAAAAPFAAHEGVAEVFTDTRPEAKVALVDRLEAEGEVVFVGDGSNDAPALAAADLGIALESGTPLAVDAADAVVTTDDLRTVETVFDVTRATRARIRQNLGWAFLYNVVAVPLAALGLLNPLFAAVAMATSSVIVVLNSRRGYETSEDRGGYETSEETGGEAL
jgi:Cu2+-exporting ATPase